MKQAYLKKTKILHSTMHLVRQYIRYTKVSLGFPKRLLGNYFSSRGLKNIKRLNQKLDWHLKLLFVFVAYLQCASIRRECGHQKKSRAADPGGDNTEPDPTLEKKKRIRIRRLKYRWNYGSGLTDLTRIRPFGKPGSESATL